MKLYLLFTAMLYGSSITVNAQTEKPKPEETEYYTPVPKVVTPGDAYGKPPSDAIILFDGTNLDEWVAAKDTTSPNKWKLANKVMTVIKANGDLQTKRSFTDFQLHIEYSIPANITGSGQARGN
ncbi:MAG: family 16 glycoside hydrolase, partial [Ferruginibacter sp.]